MRKIFLIYMLIPLLGISQNKNVLTANRVFPKVDKVLDFEKALANHAKTYHNGDWKWRVFKIQTGPDAGGYMISEGPTNWDSLDVRGNLGDAHNNDWNLKVAVYLTDRGSTSYSTYDSSLSTVKLNDYTDKIIITHMFPKPGMVNGVIGLIKKQKKVWEAPGNESVAVYSVTNSGPPQYSVVTRLKNGLKELNDSYRKPFSERYNAIYGEGAWNYWLDDYSKYVESRWSEMLFLRKDLGSN
jgi:hypothetical protein